MSRRHEITLTQLRYFATAAERRSMTEAARELFVAQSAVSAAIGQLEQQVGTQLFIRQRSKGLVLTPAGLQLLGDVRALMLGLDQAVDAARGLDNQVRGTIRLACFVTLAPFILPEVISRARAAHPYLDIEVDEVDAEEAREALRSGRAELSVGYDFAYGDGIKREVVDTTPPHVLLPAGHPLADQDRVFLRDLAREKLILLDLPHSREYFLQLLSAAGLEPEIAHRSRNYETVRAMVAHGHGFSVLNQRPRHDLTYDGRRVAARRIADDAPALRVVLATLPGVRQTARAAALAEVIRGVFRETASSADGGSLGALGCSQRSTISRGRRNEPRAEHGLASRRLKICLSDAIQLLYLFDWLSAPR